MIDPPPLAIKSDESSAIERDTEAFKKAGGSVQQINQHVTAVSLADMKKKLCAKWNSKL